MKRLTFAEAQKQLKAMKRQVPTGDAAILLTCDVCCMMHPGLSMQMLYEGAIKTGTTDDQLRQMLKQKDGGAALSDIMWA